MFVLPLILAAGSLCTLISAAPIPRSLPRSAVAPGTSAHSFTERNYVVYAGNGDTSEGWPSMSDWVPTFEQMFETNKGIMQGSCAQFGVPNNSEAEINDISNSIQSIASSTGVDARFILAIMLQESNGCVRAPTTNYGVRNPGLMQSHDGTGTCNNNGDVQDPCPASEITQMIHDGTAGTASGAGLQQCITQSGVSGVTKYYMAARIYNSGSIAPGGNLGDGIATHCYVSDIANRLMGWTAGQSLCNPNMIGELTGTLSSSSGSSSSGSSTSSSSAAPPPTTPAPAPTTTSTATFTTTVAVTSVVSTTAAAVPTLTAVSDSSSFPIYPHAISPCQEYYSVVPGDDCLKVMALYSISESQLISWNSGLDEACTNLWAGYQYCVKA